jgi:hypothetical protein
MSTGCCCGALALNWSFIRGLAAIAGFFHFFLGRFFYRGIKQTVIGCNFQISINHKKLHGLFG